MKQLLLYGATGIDGPIWYLIVFFGVKVSYSYLRGKLKMQPYNIMLASFIVAFLLWYAFRERNYIFWIGWLKPKTRCIDFEGSVKFVT